MHGNFEQNNSYPFTSSPLGGYASADESGAAVIKNIARENDARDNFVKLIDDGYEYVTEDGATTFPTAADAARAAGDLATGLRASRARLAEAIGAPA